MDDLLNFRKNAAPCKEPKPVVTCDYFCYIRTCYVIYYIQHQLYNVFLSAPIIFKSCHAAYCFQSLGTDFFI